jgi:hypothetical protein
VEMGAFITLALTLISSRHDVNKKIVEEGKKLIVIQIENIIDVIIFMSSQLAIRKIHKLPSFIRAYTSSD